MACAFMERWWRVSSDVVVLVILGVLLLILELGGERGWYVNKGFFCDDKTLRYPFTSHSAVPSWALFLGCSFIPFVTIVLGNLFERYYKTRTDHVRKRLTLCARGNRSGYHVPPWILRALYHIRWFIIGVLLTALVTDICKVTVGRLRPHFFSVCRPDFNQLNCTDEHGYQVYVIHYKCRGRPDIMDGDKVIHDSHLSFPSGHASTSAYSFVFLLLYLASVRTFYHRSALKLLLMVISFLLAALTSISRLSDHRHHPTDVLAGMAIGTGVAVIVVFYFLSFFGHHKPVKIDEPMRTEGVSDRESSPEKQ